MGGRNGLPLNSVRVGVDMVLLSDMSLGEIKIVKFFSIGVPFLLGGSDIPASFIPILLESISVDPYETSVESCVCNEREDLPLALINSLL